MGKKSGNQGSYYQNTTASLSFIRSTGANRHIIKSRQTDPSGEFCLLMTKHTFLVQILHLVLWLPHFGTVLKAPITAHGYFSS